MDQYLRELLEKILVDKSDRHALINEFQKLIWNIDEDVKLLSEENYEVFSTLAYDLDFFEPDIEQRKREPSFYGEERLELEIRTALSQLTDAQ